MRLSPRTRTEKEDKNMTLDRKIWIYENLNRMATEMTFRDRNCTRYAMRVNLRWSHILDRVMDYYYNHDEINL